MCWKEGNEKNGAEERKKEIVFPEESRESGKRDDMGGGGERERGEQRQIGVGSIGDTGAREGGAGLKKVRRSEGMDERMEEDSQG